MPRGASLFYGRNEECGLRCTYHGCKFDVTGQCTDQRSEIRSFAHRIKTTSYPVRESGTTRARSSRWTRPGTASGTRGYG
jgi:nitrite reductase/ring-hydroxylating ferredoxin subunit